MDLEDSGGGLGTETIYGTHEDSHVVMSEKVQSLAGSIYQEFERMIARYDEDVVKTLMPLLVNVLECLDSAYQANQDVELELLREDNEQLVTQYEREKGARKTSEQKLLEFEDAAEGERKELSARLEALESIVRMLELKHKNSMEHAGRLEEREGELKKEYAKLHERYTELFKTHMDYMERTKLLLSGQQLANERADVGRLNVGRLSIGRSSGPISFGFASLEGAAEGVDSVPTSPISSTHSSPSLHSELDNVNRAVHTVERSQETDSLNLEHKSMVTSPISPPVQVNNNTGRVQTRREQRSGNTLYQELSFQDVDALGDMDDGADITGGWVHPGEYASSVNDNFFGMGKEVENLIMENNELLATKNALNVVKDDLIVKVDELTGEVEMLREEILSLNMSRDKLRNRVTDLEDELKKLREANENKLEANEDEADIPMAQRKRFTRTEMARVLMERNQYKERFMELQEAVRWTEMIRASRSDTGVDKKNPQSIWKFFSNLFSSSDRPQRQILSPHLRYQAATNQIAPGVRALPRPGQDFLDTEVGSDRLIARRAVERKEQYRQVRAHVRKEDGRLQAYGWSLPGKTSSASKSTHSSSGGVPVPVPVYCRPLAETSPGMKIWCAAGVNLMGGYTRDGGLMVGGSVFYYEEPEVEKAPTDDVESLDKELNANREAALLETKLSSYVWIGTSTHSASIVTVIDANNPAEILNSFGVCSNHLLCIASVPGASCNDYVYNKNSTKANISLDEKSLDDDSGIGDSNPKNSEEVDPELVVGKVSFVEYNDTVKNKKDKRKPADQEVAGENATESPPVENSDESTNHKLMSSVLATMWLGAQNGMLFIHSAVANWNQCLHSVKLSDAVLSIVHVDGSVVVALANGTVAVFYRDIEGEWDLSQYHLVQLGLPQHSIRCLSVVGDKVWCGYRNKVHVLDPRDLKVVHTLEAHPRKESQVKQLAWLGEGVWVSIRLDSTLRLYHAHTYQHLQDVDIDPYVSKMLGTGKVGFSFVRITALLISSNRLWIGTGNGVIISVPLSESGGSCAAIVPRGTILPGAGVRVTPIPGSYIPYCSMAHAQLSFHGHRDPVKFFVSVPGNGGMSAASTPSEATSAAVTPINGPMKTPAAMLVMSGGDGYIDFRIGDGEMEESVTEEPPVTDLEAITQGENKDVKSHLIVWQVSLG
ncbi:JNK-interacting protein 3 isoform X2 [Photinus pyralis]|uniref:JNK-interacting protein 3 isoform X2 n=1 Tax=Photinus pyralis TaxID=7054 RepID=UPI0012674ED7|nr:JNK-interacting protein 3 isoform X2 [Photinus pyralis]